MKSLNRTLVDKVVQARDPHSHKGDYGRLLLIGGTYPYEGAIILSALAAVNSGAGLVTVATDKENIGPLHTRLPEAMAFDLRDEELLKSQIKQSHVIAIGPGLALTSQNKRLLEMVLKMVSKDQCLIIDGGALNMLADLTLPSQIASLILTPHQKELELISGLTLTEQTRKAIYDYLDRFSIPVILVNKRHHTRIFSNQPLSDHTLLQGGPYQATGGMGDTLVGMIAGFLGQFPNSSIYERVCAATFLHSYIADELSKERYVVLPTEISKRIPYEMKTLKKD